MFGAAAPAGAATDSFALSSASVSGQSSVTWQGPPVNPPSTPNDFPDATSPITLTGQIDPSSGAISAASLSLPAIGITAEGENTTFAFSEVHPGTATGNFNSSTDAATLNDTLTLTFTVPAVGITCVSTPIDVALSGTWDPTSQDVTLAASGFTIPQFPASSGKNCDLASPSLNASPGGTAGAVGNAMSIALHGQFAPGLPTTTTLSSVSPTSPQLQGTAVTLTATVAATSGSGTPTGSVTFQDNGASLGTGTISSGTATLTTSTMPAGTNQQLTAVYSGDSTYAASTSKATAYTVTPLPTVSANLPASITAPSASQAPTVTSLSPAAGPTAGGTKVAITGTGFTPGATVDFGSTPATDVSVTNSTSITATSPKGTGAVNVTVTTAGGTSPIPTTSFDAIYADAYAPFGDVFVYGPPTVTSVSADSGPSQTQSEVLIAGTGFTSSATVDFGSTPAAAVEALSPTSIYAVTPKAAAGTVDVTVTTSAGTSATSSTDHYTYDSSSSIPVVTQVYQFPSGGSPAGPAAGDTEVLILGMNINDNATAVSFGGTPAEKFDADAGTNKIEAWSPPGTSGTTVDITVTTAAGTSPTWPFDQFTYGPPTVSSVSPTSGPAAGGTTVSITGSGFALSSSTAAVPTVDFGSVAATNVTTNSSTEITATVPPGTGTQDVTVTTIGGTSATSPADQFTYAPTVSAISPPSGPVAGGTSVTVTGTGFTGASAVSFGGTAATNYTVVSPTEITATAPKGTAGAANVTVTTPADTSVTSPADQFFYGPPTVSSVAPDAGPTIGGTTVTVIGAGFADASAVDFGTAPATAYSVVSPTELTAVSPAGSGTDHIRVTTSGGESANSGVPNEFTYSAAPSVDSVSPNTGPPSGATNVTLTGANFSGVNAVDFGGTAATSYTVVSPTEITTIAPSGTGAVDVTVSSASGTSATGPNDVFAYGPPSVTAVTPGTGATSGGDNVVIAGTGFVSGSTVNFGGVPATSVVVISPTEITAVSPAGSAGTVDVTVANPAGTSATSTKDSFTYSAGGAPGQGSLTVTNPTSGQSWDNLYVKIVLAGITSQPASNVTLSYQDTSGDWCPLTASGTTTITAYFSGTGSSCANAPGSFSLAAGATLSVPIQVSYGSDTYLGVQGVTATLYSGTCASATSCTQSGAINGSVVGSGSYQVVPPGTLAATITDPLITTGEVIQGFQGTAQATVKGAAPPTTGVHPTGTVEYLVDGTPATLTTDGTTPAANPATIGSAGKAPANYFSTDDLSVGTHTLTIEYSGDGVFAPATVTGSFTVVAPPTGSTAYTCTTDDDANGNSGIYRAYVTASSVTPSPTLSGTSAWVSGVQVSLDADPLLPAPNFVDTFSQAPTTFALTPGGTVTGTATVNTNTANGGTTDVVSTWSGMGGLVPVSGDLGSSVPVTLASSSFSWTNPFFANPTNVTCAPVSTAVQITSVPIAGNTLSVSPSGSATPGATVTLTDTVSPAILTPNGQVTFYDGTNVLGSVPVDYSGDAANGTASYTTNQLSTGAHQLSAVWSGNVNVPQNTSNTVDYRVGLPATTSTLTTKANPAPAGDVTFWDGVKATAGGTVPTGTVAFTVDNKAYAACAHQPLGPGGGASCTVSFKAGTTHTVYATYPGSSTYSGSKSNTITLKVNGASSSTKPKVTGGSATLGSGKTLTANQSIATGNYKLIMQSDGNLVEYQGSKARWASGTSGHPGTKVTMQTDGNLVEYQGTKAIWASNTSGHSGAHLTLQGSDGNVVIYGPGGRALWASGT